MEIRSAYGPKLKVSLTTPENSRTKQAFKDECDVNKIVRKFEKTGLLDFVNTRSPQYGDVTGINFDTAMQTISQANELFADMPAKLRKRFNNEPGEFLTFIQDPANKAEALALGLLKKPDPVPQPIPPGQPVAGASAAAPAAPGAPAPTS